MFRKGISLLLAAVLMLGILTTSPISAEAVNAAKPLPALTGNYPQDIVNIAKSQLGYTAQGGTIYGKWWTEKTNWGIDYTDLDWCAMFACWVAENAGLGVNHGYCLDGASVTHLYEWYRDNHDTCGDFSEDPRPGDFILFRSATGQVKHVAIVIDYDPATRVITFIDLSQDWYQSAVAWAYENGVVLGKTDTLFAPDEALTRQQMAVLFYRYSRLRDYDTNQWADMRDFPDWESADEYAREALGWALGTGLIQGVTYPDGSITLSPTAQATRAQLATVLMRYLDHY